MMWGLNRIRRSTVSAAQLVVFATSSCNSRLALIEGRRVRLGTDQGILFTSQNWNHWGQRSKEQEGIVMQQGEYLHTDWFVIEMSGRGGWGRRTYLETKMVQGNISLNQLLVNLWSPFQLLWRPTMTPRFLTMTPHVDVWILFLSSRRYKEDQIRDTRLISKHDFQRSLLQGI
jgi:hypothetical protein